MCNNTQNKARNYDFGSKNRSNVSQISKYTSHRILYEYEIIRRLKDFDKRKKFTEEILWRIYWKGYLENYKSIWYEYKNFENKSQHSNIPKEVIAGKTGIDCFDKWIEELRENNYLHNHSRMWFASIWIFTLRLPWQLGASLFMKHLLDGDASSNTLSWRWVAGMHTNNKPYIARKENINKYTFNRFRNISINISNKINITRTSKPKSNKLPTRSNLPNSNVLIMFDNDMNIIDRNNLLNSYSKVYIMCIGVFNNGFEISHKVNQFKLSLIENINKLIPNSHVINSNDLEKLLFNHNTIDVIYPGVGYNLDLIINYANRHKIYINFIYRDEDLIYWNLANSGFYKFKTAFYRINEL